MGPTAVLPHHVMGGEMSGPLFVFHRRTPGGTTGGFSDAVSGPALVSGRIVYSDLVGYQTSDIRLLWTIITRP